MKHKNTDHKMEKFTPEILQRVYDFTVFIYPMLENFKRSETHTSAAEIKRTCFNLMRLISHANSSEDKVKQLRVVDDELKVLRCQIRLVCELKFLAIPQYGACCKRIEEIGRMLGGWIKHASR